MINALSIDLEEYFHAEIFRRATGMSSRSHSPMVPWSSFSSGPMVSWSHGPSSVPWSDGPWPSRVEQSTDKVLKLLADYAISATFFVVGEVAEQHPDLIRRVAVSGHEIACHSHRHENVSQMAPEDFREDLRRAKTILEDITGQEVIGFRAPNFSIGTTENWAFDVLLEEGFRYDSSIFPIVHDRYGDPSSPRFTFSLSKHGKGKIVEFPIATIRFAGTNFPIGGGGYFRLFPSRVFEKAINRVNKRENTPVMFYFHPWELDPEQPRPSMNGHHRFRHYVGMSQLEMKLRKLFEKVQFATAREILGL